MENVLSNRLSSLENIEKLLAGALISVGVPVVEADLLQESVGIAVGKLLREGKEFLFNSGRKVGVEVIELGLQIANGVAVGVQFCFGAVDPGIDFLGASSEFVEVGKHWLCRGSLLGGNESSD